MKKIITYKNHGMSFTDHRVANGETSILSEAVIVFIGFMVTISGEQYP